MEGHTLTPPNGCNGPKQTEAFGSTSSHSPSQSPARKQMPDCPETQYCLEIQVILTKDGETPPPPLHTWQAPMVKDIFQDGKSGLTEVVLSGPGWAILFCGRQSLAEGLTLDETWDATFTLAGAISWVSKQAHLNANAVNLQEGQQLIAQAITEWHIEPRGPRHPHSILLVSPLFSLCNQDESPWGVRLLAAAAWWRCPGVTSGHHAMNEAEH